jgi:pSer/pThr/pTyr-binding forkhead associated (FHA) protein
MSKTVESGVYLLGRAAAADIVVSSENTATSRIHAELRTDDQERLFVRDLGSRHGTFVNRVRISRVTILKPGDEISLAGQANFRVEDLNALIRQIQS